MLTCEVSLHRVRRGRSVAFQAVPPSAPVIPEGLSSGARSLTLGHRLVHAVERGEARDFSELARRMGISQPRVSMLVSLTFLAPDLQDELLQGHPAIAHLHIHHLLLVARLPDWSDQRPFWAKLRRAHPPIDPSGQNEPDP